MSTSSQDESQRLEEADEEQEEEEDDEDAGGQGEDDEEDEEGEEQGHEDLVVKGTYTANVVNDQVFEELHLPTEIVDEVVGTWSDFLKAAESRDAAGEAIYAALFDSAPSLQSLFKTPRAVMAMRFMNGLNQIINTLRDPHTLKVVVETLGFQHLDLEVTPPRVVIFRDAIVELLRVELGPRLTKQAREGWCTCLNYVGGAYVYVRVKFTDRLKILASSWAIANKRSQDELEDIDAEEGEAKDVEALGSSSTGELKTGEAARNKEEQAQTKRNKGGWGFANAAKNIADNVTEGHSGNPNSGEAARNFQNTSVPTTYNEMFYFNAAVMGFGQSVWMSEVLASFDTIVTNVSNSYRLQEECDVLSLRIAKYKGSINLAEYKAVMLASLRSLVPKDWNSAHEVAWSWLWENVERMLKSLMGKPAVMGQSLDRLLSSLDEASLAMVRREVYSKFFTLAPGGQDYFKQSTTRLHFIADRIVSMTLELFKDPQKMVEDISALGLRHVGYGIPTELFGPFVTACVQVVRSLTEDDMAEEAFRWSLSLISRILTRVINEGSTIVMKAINTNSGKALRKAVSCAPRGKRALWMLNIQVGTQSISPLLWAIENGSLEAAKAIVADLLTIRADRDRYYYGMDTMFERHPDIIRRLCADAPALLPTVLDGLVWRSRTTEGGMRRVNYYVKHLVVDAEGHFSKTIEWITDSKDPKIVCHPVLSMVTDLVWGRIAFRAFLQGKLWILFTIFIFIVSVSALKHSNNGFHSEEVRIVIFACRVFVYIFSMGQWLFHHAKHMCKSIRSRRFTRVAGIPIPEYLEGFEDVVSLFLVVSLVAMLCLDPIVHCFPHKDGNFPGSGLFTEVCPEAGDARFWFGVAASIATVLYFSLSIDLCVFSTRLSAYVLVVFRVLAEVLLFLSGLGFVILAFSSAVSALDHDNADFAGIPLASLSLLRITLGMFGGQAFELLHDDPALLVAVGCYVVTSVVFLLNLLVAQLSCSYQSTYADMVGYARLNRGKVLTEAMHFVSEKRWGSFLQGLQLDQRVEFGTGDIGLAGGIQVQEPASANITTVDMIRRFGGSTSPAAQWPEEDLVGEDDEDRFERVEKLIHKAMKRVGERGGGKRSGSAAGQSSLGTSFQNSGTSNSEHSAHESE